MHDTKVAMYITQSGEYIMHIYFNESEKFYALKIAAEDAANMIDSEGINVLPFEQAEM